MSRDGAPAYLDRDRIPMRGCTVMLDGTCVVRDGELEGELA